MAALSHPVVGCVRLNQGRKVPSLLQASAKGKEIALVSRMENARYILKDKPSRLRFSDNTFELKDQASPLIFPSIENRLRFL